jgi:hypothetical protein
MTRVNKNIIQKYCFKCKTWKDIDSFHNCKSKYDGKAANCKECVHTRRAKYYHDNKKESLEKSNVWRDKNRERVNECKRIRNKPPEQKKKNAEYIRNKKKKDPTFKLRCNFSTLIYQCLRNQNTSKTGKTWNKIVGYTLEELISYLESKFKPGMTWNNYGRWHVDHILPVSSFAFTSVNDEEFKKCWALENLQPLWAEENIKKSNKIIINK